MEPLFLGLDLSTQKLKAVIVTERLDVVNELSVDFDKDLPEFGTTNGVHVSRNEPKRITSPVRMWLKAVDLLLDKLEKRGLVGRIAAIGGCAQQHGTIYWSQIGTHSLTNLKPDVSLEEQLSSGFSIQDSPIWMDSSTCFECKEFEDFVGGPEILSKITGSRAYYRFSGPQILKLFQQQRDAYRATARISLISSFLCSLFAGKVVGIDLSDGSGMNLLDLRSKKWSKKLAGLIGDDLEEKLGDLKDNGSNWKISDYYVERYGFSPNCKVATFTGDNPSALIGMGLHPGDMGISLGTSDTVFLTLDQFDCCLEGHIFISPTDPEKFMGMLCFKNGSLVRDRMRGSLTWEEVSQHLKKTSPGNNGNIGFYFDKHEILPNVPAGVYRFGASGTEVKKFDPATEIRAVWEHQCLGKRFYAEKLGFKSREGRLILTGGASNNSDIQQMLADVFDKDVLVCDTREAAALGGAVRAIKVINTSCVQERAMRVTARPIKNNVKLYDQMMERYEKLHECVIELCKEEV